MPENNDYIELFGARENNLKYIDVILPKNKLIVVTGASGSGKSTLVVNTLYRECQRQFMNCAGIHDQFGSRPEVDRVRGLLPAVCVGQLQASFNPRSTVGTFTNTFNILRMLYCEYGIRTCMSCGKQFSSYDWKDSEVKKSEYPDVCPICRQAHSKRTVQHFSFNRVEGACPTCHGLGRVNSISLQRLLNPDKGLVTGAIKPWRHLDDGLWASDCLVNAAKYYGFSFDNTMPIKDYPEPLKLLLLYGVCDPRFIAYYPEKRPASRRSEGHYEGIVNIFMRRYQENEDNPKYRERMEQFMDQEVCPDCNGSRLNEEARNVRLMDKNLADLGSFSLYTLLQWLTEVQQHMKELGSTFTSAWQLANKLNQQLRHFVELGVGYLSLIRPMTALSGGELRRLKLASLLDSDLTGMLYILDEPTIGLHERDTENLMKIIRKLRDKNNTVIVIEHDENVIRNADYIVDMGPGGGKDGGEILVCGTVEDMMKSQKSLTARYMRTSRVQSNCVSKRRGNGKYLTLFNVTKNNINGATFPLPLGVLLGVTGVSGAGKSTLFQVIAQAADWFFNGQTQKLTVCESIEGMENVQRVIYMDQKPIGQSIRSNIATYLDFYTAIRDLFASLPEAKERSLQAKHFSINTEGGRCERCQGTGVIKLSMPFLEDMEIKCPDCEGSRFSENVLNVKYEGYTISDVLNLTVDDALVLFQKNKTIAGKLTRLSKIGLGYLVIGQSTSSLSGGEIQRLKLAKELMKSGKGHTVYLLDEPTTGLHACDIQYLMDIFNDIVSRDNTVMVIEHNLDIICNCDCLVDLGPEGGELGGELVALGTPAQLANQEDHSFTGKYIRRYIDRQNTET